MAELGAVLEPFLQIPLRVLLMQLVIVEASSTNAAWLRGLLLGTILLARHVASLLLPSHFVFQVFIPFASYVVFVALAKEHVPLLDKVRTQVAVIFFGYELDRLTVAAFQLLSHYVEHPYVQCVGYLFDRDINTGAMLSEAQEKAAWADLRLAVPPLLAAALLGFVVRPTTDIDSKDSAQKTMLDTSKSPPALLIFIRQFISPVVVQALIPGLSYVLHGQADWPHRLAFVAKCLFLAGWRRPAFGENITPFIHPTQALQSLSFSFSYMWSQDEALRRALIMHLQPMAGLYWAILELPNAVKAMVKVLSNTQSATPESDSAAKISSSDSSSESGGTIESALPATYGPLDLETLDQTESSPTLPAVYERPNSAILTPTPHAKTNSQSHASEADDIRTKLSELTPFVKVLGRWVTDAVALFWCYWGMAALRQGWLALDISMAASVFVFLLGFYYHQDHFRYWLEYGLCYAALFIFGFGPDMKEHWWTNEAVEKKAYLPKQRMSIRAANSRDQTQSLSPNQTPAPSLSDILNPLNASKASADGKASATSEVPVISVDHTLIDAHPQLNGSVTVEAVNLDNTTIQEEDNLTSEAKGPPNDADNTAEDPSNGLPKPVIPIRPLVILGQEEGTQKSNNETENGTSVKVDAGGANPPESTEDQTHWLWLLLIVALALGLIGIWYSVDRMRSS